MSQKNGFGSGFVLGSIVGGVVGGLLGTILATRSDDESESNREIRSRKDNNEISFGSEESIELARHGLEDKIAQLNLAIDDVKQQLGTVRANSEES